MSRLRLRIYTDSPVIITDTVRDPNMTLSKDIINGGVIRGFFANKYISKTNVNEAHKDERFYNWFLKGDLIFSNAVIVSRDLSDEKLTPNHIIPISIQSDKYDGSKIYDLLYSEPDTETETRSISGFCHYDGERLSIEKVNKSLNFHHVRDSSTGTVKKEGGIFNYESIDPGQIFESRIEGPSDEIISFLNYFQDENIALFGRSRNVQYGRVKLELTKLSDDPSDSQTITEDGTVISMTFLSDTIITNQSGYSSVNYQDIEQYLKSIISDDIYIEKAFLKSTITENYNSAWKSKTPSDYCIQAGSALLLSVNNGIEKLKQIEAEGIGERKNEGFGSVKFAMQAISEYTRLKSEAVALKKPGTVVPEITKDLISKVIEKNLLNAASLEGLNDNKQFVSEKRNTINGKLKVSSSLIGRLESFQKDSSNKDAFLNILQQLRKPVLDKLDSVVMNNMTFRDFIANKSIDAPTLLKSSYTSHREVNCLCGLIKYNYDNPDLNIKIYKNYWNAFFSSLRKSIKAGEKK